LVIEAVKRIKDLMPESKIKYYLIGEGKETQNLKELVKKHNLENIIYFLGSCSSELRNKYYKLCDTFIMPSVTQKNNIEGFGIVFLEANFYKIPVIGTRTGGMVEAIIDGETGLLVNPNDLDDLIKKILRLYNNKEFREKLGEKGYNRVIKEFTWEKLVGDYIQAFKSVIRN
jgi:phosphatidylinositol alpha-1,6-mannosyltransferase